MTEIVTLTGPELQKALPDLARLRIAVFREYPYLYDGTLDYEREYCSGLTNAKDSIIVAARNGNEIVGCATGSALEGYHEEISEPFRARGDNTNQIFYCGESVLLPAYRGQGIGHAFFDRREAHAREHGYRYSTFCAVVRPPDHPAKPLNYRPLDAFWMKRGYRPIEGLTAKFSWKEIGQAMETEHTMQFWLREL